MNAASIMTPNFGQKSLAQVGLFIVLTTFNLGCRRDSSQPAPSPPAGKTGSAAAQPKPINTKHPVLRMETNLGTLTLTLDGVNAPGTVTNFLNYATAGFYDNTIVHYVAPGKMIVAGGYSADRQPKPPGTSIRNEAHNGLKNVR